MPHYSNSLEHRQTHGHCPCIFHKLTAYLPMAMGAAAGAEDETLDGPIPSFTDGPTHELSDFLHRGNENTHDLFEVADAGRFIVVQGGTVIPMGSPDPLPQHDILIQDGVIKEIRASGEEAPDGAICVNADGCFVTPGFSEMHSHPATNNTSSIWAPMMGEGVAGANLTLPYDLLMFLYLSAGITRIQVMAGTPEHLALRDAVRAKRIRGPVMRVASPVIDGYPPVWAPDVSWLVGDEDGARHAARQIVEWGYDFAKPYTKLDARCYHAFAAECRALGIEITGHIPKSIRAEEALALGQRGVAHTFEYFSNPDDPERNNPDAYQRRARISANLDVTAQSTLLVAYAFEYDVGLRPDGCDPEAFLDPVMRYLMNENSPFIQGWRNDPAMVEQGRDNVKNSLEMAKALVAEGVRYVTGTDIPNPNGVARQSLHEEFEILNREVGMQPYDILKATTVHSAEHMGEETCAGDLAVGKRGDLVILERDPTKDITATKSIHAVIHGDAVLRKDEIAVGMKRVKEIYDNMPVPSIGT